VVILLSIIPQADCIVKAKLASNIFVKHIVRRLYIPNSLDVNEAIEQCRGSLKKGNNLLIFPEGTRTSKKENIQLQRSAAQISLRTGYPILPVQICADSPSGIGKGDSFFTVPPAGVIRYIIKVKNLMYPQKFKQFTIPKASRILTNELKGVIIPNGEKRSICIA
jgi:1-acyl-sn-glycerol-3-phosphate acyltransferase